MERRDPSPTGSPPSTKTQMRSSYDSPSKAHHSSPLRRIPNHNPVSRRIETFGPSGIRTADCSTELCGFELAASHIRTLQSGTREPRTPDDRHMKGGAAQISSGEVSCIELRFRQRRVPKISVLGPTSLKSSPNKTAVHQASALEGRRTKGRFIKNRTFQIGVIQSGSMKIKSRQVDSAKSVALQLMNHTGIAHDSYHDHHMFGEMGISLHGIERVGSPPDHGWISGSIPRILPAT